MILGCLLNRRRCQPVTLPNPIRTHIEEIDELLLGRRQVMDAQRLQSMLLFVYVETRNLFL